MSAHLELSALNVAGQSAVVVETCKNTIPRTSDEWEALFAPYDESTYADALAAFEPDDIVLDIGAGDLGFTGRMAERVRRVTAIEQRVELFSPNVPGNVRVICADARAVEFPRDISAALLLMRHCQHFSLYREKLERAGCKKLITNARWGMNVEVIALDAPRIAFAMLEGGWYGCACGRVGFKPGAAWVESVIEVKDCPACWQP